MMRSFRVLDFEEKKTLRRREVESEGDIDALTRHKQFVIPPAKVYIVLFDM